MQEEKELLKVLINFNFELNDMDVFKKHSVLLCGKMNSKYIDQYLFSGWREKLVASFCIACNRKIEFLKTLEKLLLDEVNGKQIKGYVLAILRLSSPQYSREILNKYLLLHKDQSNEIEWINQAFILLQANENTSKGKIAKSKLELAIDFLNANYK